MEFAGAVMTLGKFSGRDLTQTLSQIETSIHGATRDNCARLLRRYHAHHSVLAAAGSVKRLVGQINVMIHALGILLCLPKVLQADEVVHSISLGAGNAGKRFDLETDRRIAEFKFITWQGGAEAIRQNSLFKDFYGLAEYSTTKSRHLYVVGRKFPLQFLKGRRALKSVLSKNVKLYGAFHAKYPAYQVVRDYYLPRRNLVRIEDLSNMLPELTSELEV